jgi:hypothetical protein
MANRHLSRSIVLQSLFEWDFNNRTVPQAKEIFVRNAEEFANVSPNNKQAGGDFPFMEKLLDGVLDKKKDIDLIIEKAAPDWPIDKISVMDRNILRVGLYELLFADRSFSREKDLFGSTQSFRLTLRTTKRVQAPNFSRILSSKKIRLGSRRKFALRGCCCCT